jgi:hypothetical protein
VWPDIPAEVRRTYSDLLEILVFAYLPARPGGRPKGPSSERCLVEEVFLSSLYQHGVGTGSQRAARAFALVLNDALGPKRRLKEDRLNESAKRALAKAVQRRREADEAARSPAAQERRERLMEFLEREGWL